MKKLLCFLLLSGSTLLPVAAQVHLKGQRFVEVQAGFTDGFQLGKHQLGMNAMLSTGKYNRQYNAWKATISVVQKQFDEPTPDGITTTRQFAFGWGYEFNVWRNPMRTRFIRGIVQPVLVYMLPMAMTDSTQRFASTPHLLLGGDIGLEVELSPVVISVRQRWQPKSVTQPFHTLLSAGWRFHK